MTTELPTIEQIVKSMEENKGIKPGAKPEAAKEDPDLAEVEKGLGEVPPEVVVEDAPPEDALPPKKEEAKPDDEPWSKRFAAMTRMDKKRRESERQLASKQAEFEERVKAFESRASSAPKTALDALKQYGFKYDDATFQMMGIQPEKEEDPVDSKVRTHLDPLGQKLAAVEEKIKELDAATKRFEAGQSQQAEREIRYAIQAFTADGEYPYIKSLGKEAYDNVYDFMVEYWNTHKQTLTYKQACDKVEGYYNRIGSIGGAKKEQVTEPQTPPKQAKDSSAKTLTQAHSVGTRSKPDYDKMSPTQAKAEIAKAFLKYR